MSDRGTGTPGATAGATRVTAPPAAPVQMRTAAPGGSVIGGATDRGGNVRGVLPGETSTPLPNIPGAGTTDAQAQLREVLDQWGLGGLLSWAWEKLTTGASAAQIIYELRQTAEYKTRFAGNVAREAKGLTPLAEADYLGYEEQARQMFRYYGLPSSFYDAPEDFANFIGGDVSVTELHDRVVEANTALQATPEDKRAWARLYGVNDGAQLAYFIDPTRALPVLQRQNAAAQAAGAASRSGYGDLSLMSAERLAALGISQADAQAGFATLTGLRQVTGQIVGDTAPAMTEAEQIAAAFGGDAVQQENLSRRQRYRLSQFQSSGGYVAGASGATGIGPASQ